MSEVYGIVYCAVFPNEKKYIGQTTKQLQKRINEHKHYGLSPGHVSQIVNNKMWKE